MCLHWKTLNAPLYGRSVLISQAELFLNSCLTVKLLSYH